MISVRVNEIFNYLSSDHKKEQYKKLLSMAVDSQQAGSAVGSVYSETCGPSESAPVDQHGVVLRNVLTSCADVQDSVPSTYDAESKNDFHSSTAAADTRTVEQHNQTLVKKNNKDPANAGNGTRQKFEQKAEEKWKVVGKDSKHDCRAAVTRRTAVEPEISSQTKSRKKRNRRNRDRAASAATLDFRSTSCSTMSRNDDKCAKNHISETKSFHAPYKSTSKEKPAAAGVCKQLSHVKSDHSQDTFRCHSSAGDCIQDGMTRHSAKDNVKPPTVAGVRSDLCNIAMDGCTTSKPVVSSTILDTNKIDALDSFDDLMPAAAACSRQDVDDCVSEQLAADGEQWTAVNRRCKKVLMPASGASSTLSQLDVIAHTTGAHVDVERQDDRLLIIIRGSSEQIGSANRLVGVLASSIESEQAKKRSAQQQQQRGHAAGRTKNTSSRVTDGRQRTTELADVFAGDADAYYSGLSLAQESSTVTGDVDECQSKLEQAALMTAVQNSCPVVVPPSVKEYSLFDNHFSRAVESVLRNDICVHNARHAFTGTPIADEALLAKAPGYRAMADSPSSGRFLSERPRKYSNDSSSSLSSVRSCEDSLPSIQASRVLPPTLGPRTTQPDVPRGSAFHSVHELPPKVPVCAPFGEFSCSAETAGEPSVDYGAAVATASGAGCHAVSQHYSSPNEPMTLPRISTDLNPNAPDFVFRPTAHVATTLDGLGLASAPVPPDVTSSGAAAGSFFIPEEMPVTGGWSNAVVDDRTSTTAFNVSVPMLALDVPPQQWTVPTAALQESLTFG